jgi:pimeloyl-ACP methyl ester carboxylesterase
MNRIRRTDHQVAGRPGISLAVREVIPSAGSSAIPIVLVHGARAGGVASFDLPVDGGSLAGDLAAVGHPVYVMDARGYGASSRPAEMERPSSESSPLVRSTEVVEDVNAVVNWVVDRTRSPQVALLGWATGGHWAGYFATLHGETVKQIVFYNTLYGGSAHHQSLGRGSSLEDPTHPGRFNRADTGGWRSSDAASLLRTWETSIPDDDLDGWRDPKVAEAYVVAALSATPNDGRSGSLTHPAGALEDSFYLATGRQLWDASFIRAHTLVIRSERDFWSRPEDVERLAEHLIDAASVRTVTLSDATHFVHLDRPARGRSRFLEEVCSFLRETE